MPSSSSSFGTLQLDSIRSQLPQIHPEYLSVEIEDVGSYDSIATHVALLKMKEYAPHLDSTRSQLPQVYLEYLSVDIEDVGSYGSIATHVGLLKMNAYCRIFLGFSSI